MCFGAVDLWGFTKGLEGNVVVSVFTLPLLVVVIVSIGVFIVQTTRAFRGSSDLLGPSAA